MLSEIYRQLNNIKNITKVAKDCGIEKTRLWRIVNGHTEPKLDELIELELAGYVILDLSGSCPNCGTTELLCGHGSHGGCVSGS